MSVNYLCPACSRVLSYEAGNPTFLTCRLCNSSIIIPSTVVHQAEIVTGGRNQDTLEQQKTLKLAQIQSEMHAGKKLEAIKHFREAFGTSLAEAKHAVEIMEHGEKIDISGARLRNDQINPAAKNLPGIPQEKEINAAQFNPRKAITTIIFYIAMALMIYYWFFD